MIMTVLGIAFLVLFLAMLTALYIWTRRSEAEYTYDGPGLSEEQANATRFGIAMSINQGMSSGL